MRNAVYKYGPGLTNSARVDLEKFREDLKKSRGAEDVMIKYGFGIDPGPDPMPVAKKQYHVLPKKITDTFPSLKEAQDAAKKMRSRNYAIIETEDLCYLVKGAEFKSYDTLDEAVAELYRHSGKPVIAHGWIVKATLLNSLTRVDLKKELGPK